MTYTLQEQVGKPWREVVKLLVKSEGPTDTGEQMEKEEITVPVYNGREEEPLIWQRTHTDGN